MKKKIIIGAILILIVGVLLLVCYKKQEKYEGNIVSFEYNYGSYNGGYYNYKIYKQDDKSFIKAIGMDGIELNLDKEVDDTVLKDISKIVKDNKIYKWNGFDKKDSHILDGYGFTLKIKYSDGKEIKANGYMKYPNNYEINHKILVDYLELLK